MGLSAELSCSWKRRTGVSSVKPGVSRLQSEGLPKIVVARDAAMDSRTKRFRSYHGYPFNRPQSSGAITHGSDLHLRHCSYDPSCLGPSKNVGIILSAIK
jgi:hypothetical protein